MTREEAIKILSPNSKSMLVRSVDGFLPTNKVLCALEMAITALRAQKSSTLDRSRWEAHPVIKRRPYRSERFEEAKLSEEGEVLYRKIVTIHEDWTDDYCFACGKKLCSRFTNYCPACGRPLTEEAWADLESRIGGKEMQ